MSNIEEIESKMETLKEEISEGPGVVIFNKHRVKGKAALRELIGAEQEGIIKTLNKTEYVINLKEPLYVDKIYIYTATPERSINSKIILKVSDVFSSKDIKQRASESIEDEHIYTISKVCNRIILEGSAAGILISKAQIKKISITGYKPSDLREVEDSANFLKNKLSETIRSCENEIEETKITLQQLEIDKEHLESEIEVLEETKDEQENNIAVLRNTIESLEKSKEGLRNQTKALNNNLSEKEDTIKRKDAQIIELDGTIKDRESKISLLSKEAANLTEEIKTLTEDKDIFAIELQDYIKQGRSSKNQYAILAILPILVIVGVTSALLQSATTILEDIESTRPTWELLISRLPFALISFALVTASYKICGYFVKQLTHINNERLNMTKLQIIARDVTESSLETSETDPTRRQELRAKIKMAALKSYMRESFTDHFEESTGSHEQKPKIIKKDTDTELTQDDDTQVAS